MKKTCVLTFDPPMKWKTVLKKTCLWYPNLTSQTHSHTHGMQPDSRNLLTYNSTTSSVRSVQWPFFTFIQRYLKNIYNTCSAMLLYSTLLSFFKHQLNPVSTSTLSNNESESERERVVNASERFRHERSVKRPLPLFCILFHPPPSSALLLSALLPSPLRDSVL